MKDRAPSIMNARSSRKNRCLESCPANLFEFVNSQTNVQTKAVNELDFSSKPKNVTVDPSPLQSLIKSLRSFQAHSPLHHLITAIDRNHNISQRAPIIHHNIHWSELLAHEWTTTMPAKAICLLNGIVKNELNDQNDRWLVHSVWVSTVTTLPIVEPLDHSHINQKRITIAECPPDWIVYCAATIQLNALKVLLKFEKVKDQRNNRLVDSSATATK